MSSSHLNNSKLSSPTCFSTQIQTTATVHSQHQKPGPQQAAAPNQSQNQRTVKSSIGGGGGGITIPPKYQPPPQFGQKNLSGGILKHLSTPKQFYSANYFVGDLATPDELNIKYPPDIPKLSTIYIPELHSDKNHHHLRRQPLQRISSGGQQYVLDNHNMLKFVRKADQEQHGHGVPVSNIPAPGNGSVGAGRLTSEQNRHLQVCWLRFFIDLVLLRLGASLHIVIMQIGVCFLLFFASVSECFWYMQSNELLEYQSKLFLRNILTTRS